MMPQVNICWDWSAEDLLAQIPPVAEANATDICPDARLLSRPQRNDPRSPTYTFAFCAVAARRRMSLLFA